MRTRYGIATAQRRKAASATHADDGMYCVPLLLSLAVRFPAAKFTLLFTFHYHTIPRS